MSQYLEKIELPVISIRHLRDKALIESGFIVGSVTGKRPIVAVQVSIDGGAYQGATLTTHEVSVRATDTAIGAPIRNSSQGSVYISYSREITGMPGFADWTIDCPATAANQTILGEVAGSNFGERINSVDLNADGYVDILAAGDRLGLGL